MVKGVDISNNNGYLDIGNLKAQGYDFVICKATEGTYFIDKYFQNFMQQAKNIGMLKGAYHFAKFTDIQSATEEANFFISVVKQESINFVALDIEYDGAVGDLTEASKIFMDTVKAKLNVPVLFYSYVEFIKGHFDTSIQEYPLWIAQYGVNEPDIYCWNNYSLWQYEGEDIDKNIMTDEFYNLLTTKKVEVKEEVKVKCLVVFGKLKDKPLAEQLGYQIGCPVMDANILYDYSPIERVIAVGGQGELPWSEYIRDEDKLTGAKWEDTRKLVENFKL